MNRTLRYVAISTAAVLTAGCVTTRTDPAVQATALGAGIGAGLGAILGHNLGGSRNDRALGAAAGALLGGALAHHHAQQAALQQRIDHLQQQQLYTTVWVQNSNGSRTPVLLRITEGGQYIGPRGEYYPSMPSEEQLRTVYGI
ncbi:MAG: glycine zipper 2TM domain-containing protein [Kiritimatiellae bacterium]|nr:glycine zipper 2TM domain-containing protein [Kiritimatiellia bacterium]